jgi:thiamine pyrophosphokinase
MTGPGERSPLELRGLGRRRDVLAGVLVLAGASGAELRRAAALAATIADRCLLVAVDGGLDTCRADRRRPDLFVGDGDSLRGGPAGDIPAVRFPPEKDFSDLAGALGEMRVRRVQVVALAGLVGGRLDHEWANLLELAARARGFAALIAPTDRGTVVVTRHGCRAATVRGRLFSLFALGSAATVSLSGTRWELRRRRLRPGSHGLSNVTGTELELTVHAGVVALVLLPPGRARRPRARRAAGGGRSRRGAASAAAPTHPRR